MIFFGFDFKKFKKVQLSPFEKVAQAQNKVASALSMFVKASSDITEANTILEDAKLESQKEKESLIAKLNNIENNIGRANDEINANNALREEFQKFIK